MEGEEIEQYTSSKSRYNNNRHGSDGYARPPPAHSIYGEIDAEVLGYFKNVEETLDNPAFETAEELRSFVDAVYEEVEGNELVLVTDPSCAIIVEKLLRISDGFQLRVFGDRISGRSVELFSHQWGSHVCQTLLTLSADAITKEVNDPDTDMKDDDSQKEGEQQELRSMQQLVLDMCQDIKPELGALISQQYASHPIRVLLCLLAGKRVDEEGADRGRFRSKKSGKYRQAHNSNGLGKRSGKDNAPPKVPQSFTIMLRELISDLATKSSDTEMRVFAVSKVASPVLQLLLEMEQSFNDKEGEKIIAALLDRILWDVATGKDTDASVVAQRTSWFETMIRDQGGSRLLQVILKVAPASVHNKLYEKHLKGKLAKYSQHPLANFVVQTLVSTARSQEQFTDMCQELQSSFGPLLKNNKHGVIRSVVEASAKLNTQQTQVIKWLREAFGIESDEDQKLFVLCLMRMTRIENVRDLSDKEKSDTRAFHLQGSLIMQDIMKMNEGHNKHIVTSFLSQKPDTTLPWCFSPQASRAFEAMLASEYVGGKVKKKIIKNLQGHYVQIAKDKFGSHILDRIWAVAEINVKEQIVAELLKRERELAEHPMGKCVLWTVRIELYKRRHDEWVEREKGLEKKKELFKDILGDGFAAGGKPNKKRKH
ncbi:armadillo-type protein [Zychaea mexicana]|uniref:armadillo-type protein n=1 Tax=Zychaea mexicana TaxID=64656 RepID=UPI0022FE295A|nr:armadillo-type protein [Zychaea mexicana]KAI9492112.1 armadillo-type protein [Zychaea mexicana]